jgi:rubredoxin
VTAKTGQTCPKTGQWKCSGCGHVLVANKGDTMPPCPGCRKAVTYTLVKDLS